jgi:hypothetical protein
MVQHPNYKNQTRDDIQAARCVCGGIRYWHATLEGGGCEDCDCPQFTAADARGAALAGIVWDARTRARHALDKARHNCTVTSDAWIVALEAVKQARLEAMTARTIRDTLEADWDIDHGDFDDAA